MNLKRNSKSLGTAFDYLSPATIKKARVKAPLLCWDVYLMGQNQETNHHPNLTDRKRLMVFKKQFDWDFQLQEILSMPCDAYVLTDREITIQWVSSGFREMTGYSPEEVVLQSPKILQGPLTASLDMVRLRKKINLGAPFSDQIINHRKDGSPYLCKIQVFPLHNFSGDLSHFLALETELTMAD